MKKSLEVELTMSSLSSSKKLRTLYLDISNPKFSLTPTTQKTRPSEFTIQTARGTVYRKCPTQSPTDNSAVHFTRSALKLSKSHRASNSSKNSEFDFFQEDSLQSRALCRLRTQIPLNSQAYLEHLQQVFEELKTVNELPILSLSEIVSKQLILRKPLGFGKKRTLILDLDETLVHCVDPEDGDKVIDVVLPSGEEAQFGIKIRPHAVKLLSEASQLFEVIVFTASFDCYADKVLELLDPLNQYIHHRVYRESCAIVNNLLIKDLRIFVGKKPEDLVIVDNSCVSFGYHLDNGVPISSWKGDASDSELLDLLEYLKLLVNVPDMQETNRRSFRLYSFYSDYLEEKMLYGGVSEHSSRVSLRFPRG